VRPNWRSWMVWGAYFLAAQGAITAVWIVAGWFGFSYVLTWLVWPAVVMSLLTTGYTGFLFAQGLARDLWQGPQSTIDLLAQAVVEGAAVLLLAGLVPGVASAQITSIVGFALVDGMVVHLGLLVFENRLSTRATRHHQLAVSAIRRGPFARMFWGGAVFLAVLSVVAGIVGMAAPKALAAAAMLALAGSFAWEYIWVEAGQSVPLS
jgi:formate-dependent nitrite reductase membrane component NrfD